MKSFRFAVAGRRHARARDGAAQMNSTEAAYSRHLETLKLAGAILQWQYDSLRLRLANNTFYTPDFLVVLNTGEIELHEVKGHWEDDARVKVKVAAEQYPFLFVAITARPRKEGGGWKREEFTNIQAEEVSEVDA